MAFDRDRFMSAPLMARMKEIRVDAMAEYFDGPPVITVRGLTASEIALANEEKEKYARLDTIAKAIAGKNVDEVRAALGLGDDVPGDIARRIEVMIHGAVEPPIARDMAIKIGDAFPIEFYAITNEILALSAQGKTLEKPAPSGNAMTSAA